jgi:hypothetical protein
VSTSAVACRSQQTRQDSRPRGGSESGATEIGPSPSATASSVTAVSDSELHVAYPATLTPGSYPVALNGGAIPFSGSVAVVMTPQYSGQTLAFPEQPLRVQSLVYDPERNALFVAAAFSQSGNNKLWRYTYSGGTWSPSPQVVAIPDLRDVTLSADRSRLLVLTSFSITEFDVTNPASGALRTLASIPASTSQDASFFKMLALANDGNIVVATGKAGTLGDMKAYFYSASTGTVVPFTNFFSSLYSMNDSNLSTIAASADGSHVFGAGGFSTTPLPLLAYTPTKQIFARTTVNEMQPSGQTVAVDSSASRLVVQSGTTQGLQVFDSSYTALGSIPVAARLVVVNPQGTRAYLFTDGHGLFTFDISAPVSGGFPQVGASIPVTLPSTTDQAPAVLSAISPDGGTIFVAAYGGLALVPGPH